MGNCTPKAILAKMIQTLVTAFGLEFEHNQWLKGGQVSPKSSGEMGTRRRWWGRWSLKKTQNPWVLQTHKPSMNHLQHQGKPPTPMPQIITLLSSKKRYSVEEAGQMTHSRPNSIPNLDLTFVKHDPTNPSSLFLFIFEPCRKQKRQPQFALKC